MKSSDNIFLRMAETCVQLLSNRIANPGTVWAVDIVPALRHLPSWLPGMGFKRDAKVWKAMMEQFVDAPFEFAQDSITKGIATPSFCRMLLADGWKGLGDQELCDIKWAANSMYAGEPVVDCALISLTMDPLASIDTTRALVEHFIHAMITYPDVLAKAQAEVDAVVGGDRLPSFSDRPSLPYVECVMSECLRWAAPVPLGEFIIQ